MSKIDEKIDKLSEILLGFIEKQDNVNTSLEAKIFSVQTLLGAKFDAQSELLLRKLGNLDSKIEDVAII